MTAIRRGAPVDSPAFTGDATAQTPAAGDNDQSIATTAFVASYGVAANPIWDAKGDLAVGTGADTAAKLPVGSNFTHRLVANSAQSTGLQWQPYVIGRTSDSASLTAQTTPQNDDTLLWSIGASDKWCFRLVLRFNAANTAMDWKIGWNTPSGATGGWTTAKNLDDVGTGSSPVAETAIGTNITGGSVANTWWMEATGYVAGDGTHSGTMNFAWSQATSDAGALILKAGSYLLVWRIA